MSKRKIVPRQINYVGRKGRAMGVVEAPAGDIEAARKAAFKFFGITYPEQQRRIAVQPMQE